MVTKVYELVNCIECGSILQCIVQRIPCFITIEDGDTADRAEACVTIECREADLPFVEKSLAPFV